MRVDIREVKQDVIVVDLDGALVAGVGDEVLRETMNELATSEWERILLNLSGVTRIDSAGIGELVAGIRMAQGLGCTVKLLKPEGRVASVLKLSQILPLYEIYDSEDAAIESFATNGEAPAAG